MDTNNNSQNFNAQNNGANFNSQPQAMPQNQGAPARDDGRKFKIFLLVGVVVAIVLIVVLGVKLLGSGDDSSDLYDSSSDESSLENDYVPIRDFEVLEMVLASDIDEDYNVNARSSSEFYTGEDLFVYAKIGGFDEEKMDSGYKHSILESVYVYDSSSGVVDSLSRENLEKEASVYERAGQDIKFSVKIPLDSELEEGEYVVKVVYKDLISGKSISEEKSFVVRNPQKVLGGRQASLRQDFSDIGIVAGSTFAQNVSVYDPSGELIEEMSSFEEYTVPEGTEPVYDTSLVLPSSYEPGEYRVSIVTINVDTGDTIEEERVLVLEDKLEVVAYEFYDVVDGEKVEKEDNVYFAGDTVYFNLILSGFGQNKTDEGYEIFIEEDLDLYDPFGDRVEMLSMKNFLQKNETFDERIENYDIENFILIPSFAPTGDFKIVLTFRDLVLGQEITKEIPFSVLGGWEE